MYYAMDQGHNLKNVLSPMIFTRNAAINHVHAHTYKRNTQFHGEVLGRENENSHEEVIGCGHQNVCGTSEPEAFFCWLCDSCNMGGRDMRTPIGVFSF